MKRLSIPTPFFNAPVYYLEETKSTMTDADDLIRSGASSGTVIAAGYQSEGRGRVPERRWDSPRDANLLFTLIIEAADLPLGPQALPLRSGLGLARYLEEAWGLGPRIKWPNDLLVGGGKIAGILCRGRGAWVSIGMGLNLSGGQLPEIPRRRATSLEDEAGVTAAAADVLEGLLPFLKSALNEPEWQRMTDERLFGTGETVRVFPGEAGSDENFTARIRGIDGRGALLLETESGEISSLLSGEILF
jgi:BirA family transcriptional regulator, biotin operon repressor / biotin---[acetyl-CoA-carboxylase] ligase